MDALKIVHKYEDEACPASDPPAGIADIPLFDSFFNHPEDWERIHVHLCGVLPECDDPECDDPECDAKPTSKTDGIKSLSLFSRSVNASVKFETVGKDTGSTDYFNVGEHSFKPKKNAVLPSWDERGILLCKKGSDFTSAVQLTMTNESTGTQILKKTFVRKQLPPELGKWKSFVATADPDNEEEKKQFGKLRLLFELKVTSCTEKIVSKKDIQDICNDTKTHSYTEEVLGEGDDRALLQYWQKKEVNKKESKKAVFWIIGRNDCFMHPHVAKELFFCQGYDLYVLNWTSNGMCRKRGWVANPFMVSHNHTGNADLYLPQIRKALEILNLKHSYAKVLGYAHSTGAALLVHYLLNDGDKGFSGFILNSPMFDLAQGNPLLPLLERAVSLSNWLGITNPDSRIPKFVFPYGQTDGLKNEIKKCRLAENHLQYLGEDIDISVWPIKLRSQYEFDGRARRFFETALTVGYMQFVAKVTKALDQMHKDKKHLTLKPIICFSSRLDDILLDYTLLHNRLNAMGPSRLEIEMRHNSHDIFLSEGREADTMAMEMIKTWMKSNSL